MVQFHAKLVTTHISSHNSRAQKVRTQEFGDKDGGGEESGKSLLVEKFVVVGMAACLLLL